MENITKLKENFIDLCAKKAYSSYAAAMDCPYAGTIYFWDGNALMRGYMRQPWEFEPVTEKSIDAGINWATRYFAEKNEAIAFATEHWRNRGLEYNAEYDVYSINYHL